jgi:hypothetical protein
MQTGFITARTWETLLFGTIPVGFREFTGIAQYLPDELIVQDARELGDLVQQLSTEPLADRSALRNLVIGGLGRMDVSNFIDRVEAVADGQKPVEAP